jgi:hypothetical protein
MWRRPAFLSLFALCAFVTVSAQGDDSVSITSSTSTIDTFADFTYEFKGEAGHDKSSPILLLHIEPDYRFTSQQYYFGTR